MKIIRNLRHEIKKAYSKNSTWGTIRYLLKHIYQKIIYSLKKINSRNSTIDSDDNIDIKYGTDTESIVRIGELDITSENAVFAIRYQPIGKIDFEAVLSPYKLDYSSFTFIDYGCGKGKALLLASRLPFKAIIGVEFSEELVSIAKSNILKYPQKLMLCNNIEIKCLDAVEFITPEQPLIIYFYNPFEEPVMKIVINNLCNSYLSNPREIIILYFNPVYSDLFEKNEFFIQKYKTETLAIYFATSNKN